MCYEPLDVSDGESVAKVVRLLDKCNGHPCGVHAPQSLINDATELFLLHRGGTDGPSINVDGDNRGAAGRDREPRRAPRTVRTHNIGAPPPDVGQRGPGSFSWYACLCVLSRVVASPPRGTSFGTGRDVGLSGAFVIGRCRAEITG